MSVGRFLAGFLIVTLLSYGKGQLVTHWQSSLWAPIEFSYLMIFLIIRSSSEVRALIFTFLLSFGLDLIFQVGLLKGLPCMGQLLLVYLIMKLKRNVVPAHQDMFLFVFFALFYLLNYYLYHIFNSLLGADLFTYQVVSFPMLIFLTMLHTAIFGLVLLVDIRFLRRGES